MASVYSFLVLPLTPLWAQSFDLPDDTDLFAPIIQHRVLEEQLPAGGTFRLKAKVKDNIGVTEVLLYYRVRGEENYSSINMEPIGQDHYATVLTGEDLVAPGLEYYIQAKDLAGNTSQRAFPFSPLVMEIVVVENAELLNGTAILPAPRESDTQGKILTDKLLPEEKMDFALSSEKPIEPQELAAEKRWYKKWWVWAIAVAVVGGAVAAGGSGGGDGPGPTTAGAGTGSAQISGGLP